MRESVAISVGTQNIDIQLHFSFPSALSLSERQRMDRDADGRLSKQERKAYLAKVVTRAEEQLRLSFAGKAATLIPLEDPVLDLQDAPDVEAHPHELKLAYFARVPESFGDGGTFTLDSGMWTELPLMVSVAVESAPGIRFHTADAQGLRPPSKGEASFRITEARCVLWQDGNKKDGRK